MFAPFKIIEQPFEQIEEKLLQHFAAKRNIIVERYKFHMFRQKPHQSSADFFYVVYENKQ